MNTPYNSVSAVAGGSGQPTGRCRPDGGAPHPAAGPGAPFPGGSHFRCDGRGRRARTDAAAAGHGSGGGGGSEQGRRGEFRDMMFGPCSCMLRAQGAVLHIYRLVSLPPLGIRSTVLPASKHMSSWIA